MQIRIQFLLPLKTYEDLISKGYQAEVITVAGVESRGVQADEKNTQGN